MEDDYSAAESHNGIGAQSENPEFDFDGGFGIVNSLLPLVAPQPVSSSLLSSALDLQSGPSTAVPFWGNISSNIPISGNEYAGLGNYSLR